MNREDNIRIRLLGALVIFSMLAASGVMAEDRESRFEVELEVGPTWQSRNEVQIPNDESGTRFSLVDLVGDGPWVAGRVYFTWNINERHGVRVLLAPLSYTETGTFDMPVEFAGESYAPDAPTEATYQFDSWRLSYRYRIYQGPKWRWWIGFTAKVRDAKIRLEQGATVSEDTDVGFVPLLHVRGEWRFAELWRFILDLDALAGGPGRAEDLALKISYDLGARWSLAGGYRTVEGGADVEDVYNFAWFNAAVFSASYRF